MLARGSLSLSGSEPTQAGQLPLALTLRQGQGFDSFVARGNEPLVALLRQAAEQATGQLFLRGEPGTGRSHLLEATVGAALAADRRACLLPGEELARLPPSVLEGMEQHDLVALDDVDALAGDADWEEALFHFYNRCRAEDVTQLFAARQGPRHLGIKLADLATRLAAAGVHRVRALDEQGLLELLNQRAGARGLTLEEEVRQYIIRRHDRSPAALVATLERLDREALARKRRLTLPFVKEVMGW